MTILLYAGSAGAIGRVHLGSEDYSYRFLLESFRQMFERAGRCTVIEINDPDREADLLFEQCRGRGESCTLLSITPPHRAPVGLACPTICVFAWEFSTIPNEPLDADPRSDWRYVFAAHGRAIALSRYTARVVRAAMGDACTVAAIPAPVWDEWQPVATAGARVCEPRVISFDGELRDSATHPELRCQPVWPRPLPSLLAAGPIAAPAPPAQIAPPPPPPPLALPPEPQAMDPPPARSAAPPRRRTRERISLTRYYALEWYRATIRDLLPRPVAAGVSACGRLGHGLYKGVVATPPQSKLEIGGPAQPPLAADGSNVIEAAEPAPHPESPLALQAPVASPPERRGDRPAPRFDPPPAFKRLHLDGIVYTTMLNPTCGRKNWYDIVTAFVWAFRDDPDATLVIKLVHADPAGFHPALDDILRRLAPFTCRVVTITGYLEPGQLADLIAATDFYVNASHAEGLCLPLMEFMSAGTPAIAPDHTAMADYISSDVAFIVRSSPEHNVWPHDPRDLFRTMRYRIEWNSLREAYCQSARVLRSDRARYDTMAASASQTMRLFCSRAAVLQAFDDLMELEHAPPPGHQTARVLDDLVS